MEEDHAFCWRLMWTVTYSCMEEAHAFLLSSVVDCNLQLHVRGPCFCCRLIATLTYSCMEEAHTFLLSSYMAPLPSPLSLHMQAAPAAQTEERLRQR
jgi:hypothetical protein